MTSIGLRPALLFFSLTGVKTAASISTRKLSNGTTRAIISSGSPFAVIAASRRSASKNPNCPIVPTPANLVVTNQTRTNSRRLLFFEVPLSWFRRRWLVAALLGHQPSTRKRNRRAILTVPLLRYQPRGQQRVEIRSEIIQRATCNRTFIARQ